MSYDSKRWPVRQTNEGDFTSFAFERWTPRRSGKLYGFATVRIGPLRISGIKIFAGKDGFFASMPSTSWTKRDGSVHYSPIVEFIDKGHAKRFSDALIRQITAIDSDISAPQGDATVVTLNQRHRADETRNDPQPEPLREVRSPTR
jgi:DNA-binding cell septation regulator SpoVG